MVEMGNPLLGNGHCGKIMKEWDLSPKNPFFPRPDLDGR
jgi:hypothetical protein